MIQPPYLFLMLGYPGAGKSFFARQLAPTIQAVRLNGDSIRTYMFTRSEQRHKPWNQAMVFGALDYALIETLKAGHSVIYDAGHNRIQDRTGAAKLVRPLGVTPVLIWVQAPLAMARERMLTREDTADQHLIPLERYDQLVANLTPPTSDEACIVIDGSQPFEEQLAEFKRQLHEL